MSAMKDAAIDAHNEGLYRNNNGFVASDTPTLVYFKAGFENAKVEVDKKVVTGVSICTEGYAKGHWEWIDSQFIDDLVAMGNDAASGIRCRVGHPTWIDNKMTEYVGTFANFRSETRNGTYRAVADLTISPSAAVSPSGNLEDWVLAISAHDPLLFGVSIVFRPGIWFYKSKSGGIVADYDDLKDVEVDDKGSAKLFVTIKELLAADIVDEPAANNSMYGNNKVNNFINLSKMEEKSLKQISNEINTLQTAMSEKEQEIRDLKAQIQQLSKLPADQHQGADGGDTTPKPTTIDYANTPWNQEAKKIYGGK